MLHVTHHMKQDRKGSVACVAAAAMLMPGKRLFRTPWPWNPMANTTAASSHMWHQAKQPLPSIARLRKGTKRYIPKVDGPCTDHAGLSSYKYDALLMKMAEAAEADNGFKSDAIKTEFMKNLKPSPPQTWKTATAC